MTFKATGSAPDDRAPALPVDRTLARSKRLAAEIAASGRRIRAVGRGSSRRRVVHHFGTGETVKAVRPCCRSRAHSALIAIRGFRQLCQGGMQGGGIDDRSRLGGLDARQRARGEFVRRLRAAVLVERDEASQILLAPPSHGVEVDRREGAVQQHRFVAGAGLEPATFGL